MSLAGLHRTASPFPRSSLTRIGLAAACVLASAGLAAAGPAFGPRAGIVTVESHAGATPVAGPAAALSAAGKATLAPSEAPAVALALEAHLASLVGDASVMPAEVETLSAYYADRAYAPVWTSETGLTARAARIGDWLGTAADDGLHAAAYPMPRLTPFKAKRPELRAEAELRVALSVMRYADHAQAGTLDPKSISRLIDVEPVRPDPREVLETIASADDPAVALDAYNPPHAGYRNLRKALIALNEAREVPVVEVPPGRTLRKGVSDPRVTILRERLGLLEQGDSRENGDVFDAELEEAVRAFQAEHGLLADGIVGPRTLSVLNGGSGNRREAIIANMERWRWLPRDLGTRYVHVNIPEFLVRIMEGREAGGYEVGYEGRVVVGKPQNATPVFSDEIEHVVVNPYWNVPYSIASGEMLPKLRRDPGYYARRGYETISSSGQRIDPYAVNWSQRGVNGIRFRQRPGSGNALGTVKFLFPNDHAVYLHDTNAKSLFSRSVRAFSHGCVRLHEPWVFAQHLLAKDADVSASTVKASIGGKERWFNTADHIPVHITYFTVTADEGGALDFAGDIYGFDRRVQQLMGVI